MVERREGVPVMGILSEENYQSTKKKISYASLIILLIGLTAGGLLIYLGYSRGSRYDKSKIKVEMNKEFMGNGFTERYYELQEELDKSYSSKTFYIFGGFIIAASCMISGFVFILSRGREIAAYQAQQIMPIAQEGMKQMAPTVNEVMRESAPVYGEVAKEIAKGVKEGMNKDM